MSTSWSFAVSRMIGTGLRARTSRQMSRPRAARHHDVEDQQVEARVRAAELAVGVLAVDGERDVEALLARARSRPPRGPRARRRLSGSCPSAPAAAAHATGVVAGCAARSRTQNVLPSPSIDSTPISPPITSTIRRAIERPSPNPSCSSEPRAAVEALEDPVDLLRGDPDAGVDRPRSAPRRTSPVIGADRHPARARGVFLNAFVSSPISTWRSSTRSPCADEARRRASTDDLDPLGRGDRLGGLLDHQADVERLGPALADRLHPRQREQRLGQAADPLGVLARAGRGSGRAPRGRPWRRRAGPRPRPRSRRSGCAARARRWRRTRARRPRAAAPRCGRGRPPAPRPRPAAARALSE